MLQGLSRMVFTSLAFLPVALPPVQVLEHPWMTQPTPDTPLQRAHSRLQGSGSFTWRCAVCCPASDPRHLHDLPAGGGDMGEWRGCHACGL